ncbi:hypothetical protein SLA2020_087600 [Shorea laevis]
MSSRTSSSMRWHSKGQRKDGLMRHGLASDDFNPFKHLSSVYRPKGPGNDIDVYLQPLVEELKKLWDGVDTYDATSKGTFKMRVALLWTISDFAGLSMLSGQNTQGRFACPCCGESTCSMERNFVIWAIVNG